MVNIKKSKLLLWILISVLLSSLVLLILISKKINPILYRYASVETKRFALTIINYDVKEVIKGNNLSDLYKVSNNSEGDIKTLDFNTKKVNSLLNIINKRISNRLIALEEGRVKNLEIAKVFKGKHFPNIDKGIVCEIPMGSLLGNGLLANLGPLIPIKLLFVGSVSSTIKTDVKTYGINNVYLEVNIIVSVTERIIMPTFTKDYEVSNKIPLLIKVINGKIPNYYQGYINNKSLTSSLPIIE